MLLAGCTTAPQPTTTTESVPIVRITSGDDGRLEPLLAELAGGLPGAQAGIAAGLIQGDDVTIGFAGNPDFAADTLFEYGSITKVFTAIMLAQLAGDGVLALDDSINPYLPAEVQDPQWETVTLRDLATHTAGLPRLPDNLNPLMMILTGQMDDPYARFDQADLYEAVGDVSLEAAGETAAYSNFGYALLGDIVSRRAARPYAALLQERLFTPLGMDHARVDEWAHDTFAPPLSDAGGRVSTWTLNAFQGAGAARGSLDDALAFVKASLVACAGGTDLARANCLAQQGTGVSAGQGTEMGLGWTRTTRDRQTAIWHNGGTGGYRTFLGFNPDTGTGLVVLSNVGSYEVIDPAALTLLTTTE